MDMLSHRRKRRGAVRDGEHKAAGRSLVAQLLWEERRAVGVTFACSLLAAALEGTGIGLLIPLLHSITDPAGEPLRSGIGWVDAWVLAADEPPLRRLYQVSAAIFVSIGLRTGLGYVGQVSSLKVAERVLHRVRTRLFAQLSDVALSFYASTRSGDLLNTLLNEVRRVGIMFNTVANILIRGLVLVAYAALALWMSWELTAIALCFLALLSLALRSVVAKTRGRGREVAEAYGEMAAVAGDFIAGGKTVRAFGAEAYERARFHEASQRVAERSVRTGRASSAVKPIAEALASGVLIALVVVSAHLLVTGGDLTVPTLLTFLFALFRLLPIVHELNNARATLASVHGSWLRVLSMLARDDKPYLEDGALEPPPLREAIRFENVSFAYEPGRPVLRDVSLTIRRGQTLALVGASGAGKSTLVDLVPRLADPTEGRVLLDGVDLRDLRLDALRSKIAVVSQDTFLFHETVARNIAYGLEGVPTERVREVARLANALGFIEALPDGFDTVLGDRGVRLSGGQRQRIAIARALLRDPEILILDEATSSLDSVSERAIQDALGTLKRDRTVITVAHRLSTIEDADVVVVLEKGKVVEAGTYEELVALKGELWKYHALQFQVA
jgi:ATP-binding cassette, subfamily B, bacterial MsbA